MNTKDGIKEKNLLGKSFTKTDEIIDKWYQENFVKNKDYRLNDKLIEQLKSEIIKQFEQKEQRKKILDDLINDTDNKGVIEWLKHKKSLLGEKE
jgi:hypothetical protein